MNALSLRELSEQAVSPIIEKLGYGVVLVDLAGDAREPVLRVLIERSEPGAFVSIDDCVVVTRALNDHEELDRLFPRSYRLEVSSPGVDRPLVRERDYLRFVGERVQVSIRTALDGRRKFLGRLVGLEDGKVVLELGPDAQVRFALDNISKANLKPDLAELLRNASSMQAE